MSDPGPCREQIVVAVQGVMAGITTLPSERNRKVALTSDELPRQILFEDDETPFDLFAGQDGYQLPLLIQVAVAKSGAAGATDCNSWRAQMQKKFLADRTLGGLAMNLEITEPGDWIGVDVDSEDFEGFILSLTVTYATVEGDPFTFA
jgi:hypothetical protein